MPKYRVLVEITKWKEVFVTAEDPSSACDAVAQAINHDLIDITKDICEDHWDIDEQNVNEVSNA
jgi:hypothetical protein